MNQFDNFQKIEDNGIVNENINFQNEKSDKIKLGWKGMDVNLMPGDSIIMGKNWSVFVTGEFITWLVEFQKSQLGTILASWRDTTQQCKA